MRRTVFAIVTALLVTGPACGEEVFFCADEGASGFAWDAAGDVGRTDPAPLNFSVQVVSEAERWIHWEGRPTPLEYNCQAVGDDFHCLQPGGTLDLPIVFGPQGFARARLGGGTDADSPIGVAYGTCANSSRGSLSGRRRATRRRKAAIPPHPI